MSQKQEILIHTKELFFRLGVRSVTMDDISRELGISKKTLYLHFDNKEDIVEKVMKMHFEDEKEKINDILHTSENSIDFTISLIRNVLSNMRNLHPSAIFDIQKYYPKVWKQFQEFKNDFIYNSMLQNLEKGVEEGFYRNDLNTDIIARVYINTIDFVVSPFSFPSTKYNFMQVYLEYVTYHIRGVVSEKGYQYLKTLDLSHENI